VETAIPDALRTQLRPAFPRLRVLLKVLADDRRQALSINDILVGLYLATSEVLKRSTVTEQLSFACQRGFACRAARGRYTITAAGREKLAELLSENDPRP